MKINLNSAGKQSLLPTYSGNKKQSSFGSIAAQPQNTGQIQQMSQIAYKTKEAVTQRFGSESPVLIKANITHDTAVFSSTGAKSKQNLVDSIMQFYLRRTDIPFKQI